MSILDKFTSKVSDTAKAAAKKSGDLVEVTKLNVQITQENDKITKEYEIIGQLIFEKYAKGEKLYDDILEKCEKLVEIKSNIQDMKDRINKLKNVRLCKNCGAEISPEVIFCPSCGVKQVLEEIKKEDIEKITKIEKVCSACSAMNALTNIYCSSCGVKL